MGRWPAFFEPLGELAGGGGLTGALQAGHEDDGGRLRGEVLKRAVSLPRMVDELVVDDFDDLLGGREGGGDLRAEGLGADVLDEVVDDVRLTSDSRRARRISRRASLMFSSVMVPWPRRVLKERWSLSERFSNMAFKFSSGYQFKGPKVRCKGKGWGAFVASNAKVTGGAVEGCWSDDNGGRAVGGGGRENLGMKVAPGMASADGAGVCDVSAGGEGAAAASCEAYAGPGAVCGVC
jgi:hypothetical protein